MPPPTHPVTEEGGLCAQEEVQQQEAGAQQQEEGVQLKESEVLLQEVEALLLDVEVLLKWRERSRGDARRHHFVHLHNHHHLLLLLDPQQHVSAVCQDFHLYHVCVCVCLCVCVCDWQVCSRMSVDF